MDQSCGILHVSTFFSEKTHLNIISDARNPTKGLSVTDEYRPAVIFGIAICTMFIADRTGFWLKEQKQFSPTTFGFLSLCSLGLGLLTLKRGDKDMGFMNREQTDEWKGWMQGTSL